MAERVTVRDWKILDVKRFRLEDRSRHQSYGYCLYLADVANCWSLRAWCFVGSIWFKGLILDDKLLRFVGGSKSGDSTYSVSKM